MKVLHLICIADAVMNAPSAPLNQRLTHSQAYTNLDSMAKGLREFRAQVLNEGRKVRLESAFAVSFTASSTTVAIFANAVSKAQVTPAHVQIELPQTVSINDAFALSKSNKITDGFMTLPLLDTNNATL